MKNVPVSVKMHVTTFNVLWLFIEFSVVNWSVQPRVRAAF